jgi:hypothetical protein
MARGLQLLLGIPPVLSAVVGLFLLLVCVREGGNETEKGTRKWKERKATSDRTSCRARLVGSFGREGREFLSVVELIAVSIAA